MIRWFLIALAASCAVWAGIAALFILSGLDLLWLAAPLAKALGYAAIYVGLLWLLLRVCAWATVEQQPDATFETTGASRPVYLPPSPPADSRSKHTAGRDAAAPLAAVRPSGGIFPANENGDGLAGTRSAATTTRS